MIKLCKNGLPSGYNGHYHNPEYINKQRIAQHKRWGTSDKLNLSKPYGVYHPRMTQKDYLKSNLNPFNNPKYQFKDGHISWSKGIKRPDVSERMKKDTFWMRKLAKIKPTSPERKIIEIIKRYNLPYKYVGNGDFIIGNKNPDFVNINGQKKVIEVFGDYWHTKSDIKWHQTEFGTHTIYSQYGFKVLIIYESELNKHIENVIDRIKKFEMEGDKHGKNK